MFYVTEKMMHVVALAILSTVFLNVFSFNLDTLNPIVYEDFLSEGAGRSSYFGYSVVLYSGSPSWVLIGAPRANFSHYVNVTEPGVTVRCAISGNCTTVVLDSIGNEEPEFVGVKLPWDHKDKAWIGVSMDIEKGQNLGKAVVCGHRWKDQKLLKEYQQLYMPGVCYWMESPYESAQKCLPFTDKYVAKTKGVREYIYGMAQSGSSVHLPQKNNKQSSSTLLIGAPGAYSWEGTNVICEDGSGFSSGKEKRAAQPNSFNKCQPIMRNTLLAGDQTFPYIGYSVSSGKFFPDQELLFVSSAPRSYLKGAVIIFRYLSSTDIEIIDTLRGETIAEYFGASITVSDINGDGHEELVVGAPFYSVSKDEGRVYVFTRSNSMKTMKLWQTVNGQQPGSQFGLAVTSLGLLNRDDFDDIAVGAPYEDNGHGAVYIYSGGYEGLKLSQKISSTNIYPHLRGFGISLSNAADIDSNGIKDVAVGSYLSGHAVILRASPVIILRTEIYANTFLIQRTTTNFSVHPAIECIGCESAHKFSVNLKLTVDTKYDQAFVDERMSSHEFNEKLQFEKQSTKKNAYVKIFIKEDPDTQKDIEINLLIEMENKTGNAILIKKDKQIGEDTFCKNCAVVDDSKSQLKNTKIVKFANACGHDGRCDAYLQMACSIKNPRYYGKNIYIVGSGGLISLEVLLHNNREPAYSVTLTVKSEPLIEPARIPKMCKQTINLEIVCEIGNIYNTTGRKNITVEFDVMSVTKYAFLNENASMLNFSVIVNTTSNNINNATECSAALQFEREARMKISGSSKPDYLLLKGSDQHLRHLYKAVKEGPTPVKLVHFMVDVPTHYTTDNEKSVKFISIQPVQFYQNGKEISCRYPDQQKVMKNSQQMFPVQDQTLSVRVKKSTTLQEEHTQNKYMNTASENKTLFLNCSSSNVKCQKVICSASEMWNQNSYFDVPIDLVFNASSLIPLMGTKSTILFSTSANAEISMPKDMPMSDRKSVSTVIVPDKPYGSVAAWIIILAIIGGILLLCLLVFGMKKAGFFRRRKKELLLNATLQKESEGQTATG